MNTEAYISSGKLEQYLLGLLTEAEAREVEQVAAAHPEIKAELNAMEDALAQYAMAKAVPMPADLSQRIIRRLEKLDEGTANTNGTPKTQSGGGRSILPLIGLLLAGAIAGLVYFWFQTDELREELDQTQTNLEQLQEQCDQVRDTLDQAELQLAILRSEGNETFIMRGDEQKIPGAIANIYYNSQAQQTYLDIRELPPPPAGQQYQLWGIGEGGVQSLDVFNLPQVGTVNFIAVPYLPDISTFAVSLEPIGGSPTPTDVVLISG